MFFCMPLEYILLIQAFSALKSWLFLTSGKPVVREQWWRKKELVLHAIYSVSTDTRPNGVPIQAWLGYPSQSTEEKLNRPHSVTLGNCPLNLNKGHDNSHARRKTKNPSGWVSAGGAVNSTSSSKREGKTAKYRKHSIILTDNEKQKELNSKRNLLNDIYFTCLIWRTSGMWNQVTSIWIFSPKHFRKSPFARTTEFFNPKLF